MENYLNTIIIIKFNIHQFLVIVYFYTTKTMKINIFNLYNGNVIWLHFYRYSFIQKKYINKKQIFIPVNIHQPTDATGNPQQYFYFA